MIRGFVLVIIQQRFVVRTGEHCMGPTEKKNEFLVKVDVPGIDRRQLFLVTTQLKGNLLPLYPEVEKFSWILDYC